MKIAICMSGQIRTGIHAFENQRRFFGDLWESDLRGYDLMDVFIHTWNVNTNKRFGAVTTSVPERIIKQYSDLLKPKLMRVDDYHSDKFSHLHKSGAKAMFYSWKESVLLKQEWEKQNNFKYDIVVRLRPEVIFRPGRNLAQECLLAIADNVFVIDRLQANWRQSNFTDDIFWVAPNDLMDKSLGYYDFRFSGNTDEHPSFSRWLDSNGITPVPTVGWSYTVLRKDVTHLHAYADFFEIQQHDWDWYVPGKERFTPYPDESPHYY